MIALLLVAPSLAQTFTVTDDSVLAATTRYPNGMGAPAIAWDGSKYVMYFESRDAKTVRGCAESWSIGQATSTDGVNFTVLPKKAVATGTGFECGARHPSIVVHDDGTYALFFQALSATADDGVGVLTNWGGATVTRMLESLRGLYEPTAARVDGSWGVMGVDASGLVIARSTDLVNFTFDAAPEIANGATPWSTDGMLMPALGCIDGTAYPWELYFGGWSATETGWAWAIGAETGAWYVTAPYELWTDDSAWDAIDFVTDGTYTRVYFETLDASGKPQIGVSDNGGAPSTAGLRGRDCQ